MTAPAQATIAESLFADLRTVIDTGDFDSPFTRSRLWREAEKLCSVDASGGLLAKAWLAAMDRDVDALCRYTQTMIRQRPDAQAIGAIAFALISAGLLPQAADLLEDRIQLLHGNGDALAVTVDVLISVGRFRTALSIAQRFAHLSARLEMVAIKLRQSIEHFHQHGIDEQDFACLSETVWQTFRAFGNGRFIGRLHASLICFGDESGDSDGREHAIYVRYAVASPADADLSALIDLCMAVDEALAREHPDNPAALYWTCNFVPFEPQAVGSRAA
ncbi:hypothetical protein [Plasticicumulans sp.]|uniref:hypothetical protein n=1 Tax=Plasticicumulans sp. TaxID=2307179 RepID=UPI00395CCBDA